MFCDQCGKPLSMDSKFCPSCGKPVATPQISPAQPGNLQMQQSVPPQPLFQDIESLNVNESDFEMTTATMVVGIIFFILTLIIGIGCACIDLFYIDELESVIGAKVGKLILIIDGGLIYGPIKGFVDIGKGKSYKSEAIVIGISSIVGIISAVHYGGNLLGVLDFITTGIFSFVLFIMALCHEK